MSVILLLVALLRISNEMISLDLSDAVISVDIGTDNFEQQQSALGACHLFPYILRMDPVVSSFPVLTKVVCLKHVEHQTLRRFA